MVVTDGFRAWFDQQLLPLTEVGCREWGLKRSERGYGVVKRAPFREWRAHRVAWVLAFGAIPAGLKVLHTCDNPPCCRVLHLFIGTTADNHADMMAKGRHPQIGDAHWTKHDPERVAATIDRAHEFQVRGERIANSKLTEPQVLEIRAARANGASMRSLGRQYGVHWHTIDQIVRRVTWQHI